MKKYTIFLVILLPLLIGCSDGFLTRTSPTSTTDEDWWTTREQLQGALGYIYSGMPAASYTYPFPTNDMRVATSALTDNAVWSNNYFSYMSTFAQGDGTPTTGGRTMNMWGSNYDYIRQAARFLKFADRAAVRDELKQRMKAEARALLGWYHLTLFMYWKNIPVIRNPVEADEINSISNDMSADKIVEFIATQLDSAAANLPYSYSENEEWRITKGACFTFKAMAYLNNKNYEKAAKAANQVIKLKNNDGQKVYQLYRSDDGEDSYSELFRYEGEINDEGILLNDDGALENVWFRHGPAGMSGGPKQAGLSVTASLVNAYETKQGKTLEMMSADSARIYKANPNFQNNRDPRLDVTVLLPAETWDGYTYDPFNDSQSNPDRITASTAYTTGFGYQKALDIQDRGSTTDTNLDYMVIRYAQVLLIRVEALVEMGEWQHPDVFKYLNMIRDRAGMPDVDRSVYNTQAEVRQLYQRERRVELALEGWRWFDIRRWGIADKVMNGTVFGAVDPQTGNPVNVVSRNYGSEDELLPIPLNEIESSIIQQNPGY